MNTKRHKITAKIKYLDDLIPRLKSSKQKIEESIQKRRVVLANCEFNIQQKKTTRDSLKKELHVIEIRRKPLSEEQKKENCPKCGHSRSLHHNPDDRCVLCGCGHYFYAEMKAGDEI